MRGGDLRVKGPRGFECESVRFITDASWEKGADGQFGPGANLVQLFVLARSRQAACLMWVRSPFCRLFIAWGLADPAGREPDRPHSASSCREATPEGGVAGSSPTGNGHAWTRGRTGATLARASQSRFRSTRRETPRADLERTPIRTNDPKETSEPAQHAALHECSRGCHR